MSNEITFNIIDWNEYDDLNDDNDEIEYQYIIELYGRTICDKSIYVKVLNFTPHFFVEIPKKWNESHLKIFINFVKNKVYGKSKESLIAYDMLRKHKLKGFNANKKFKFVRLVFDSLNGMNKYKWIFNNKHKIPGLENDWVEYKLYESNINPMIKFMHIKNINASGWVKISKYNKLPNRGYNTDLSIEVNWKDIISLHEDNSICKKIIASYDIECTTGDPNRFPQANIETDKIIQIGTTFSYDGEEECFYEHIITLGGCLPINGVTVECCNNEEELLYKWENLLVEKDPDIITGWNIVGFDESYIYNRAKFLGIHEKFG